MTTTLLLLLAVMCLALGELHGRHRGRAAVRRQAAAPATGVRSGWLNPPTPTWADFSSPPPLRLTPAKPEDVHVIDLRVHVVADDDVAVGGPR